jgi:hypothetical protein
VTRGDATAVSEVAGSEEPGTSRESIARAVIPLDEARHLTPTKARGNLPSLEVAPERALDEALRRAGARISEEALAKLK